MTARGIVLTALSLLAVCANATTYYVDASRPDDTGAATDWATAKKTIQAAVNIAVSNDTVLVTNGVYNTGTTVPSGYSLMNRVVVNKDIIVQSVNGPTFTTIQGSGTSFFGTVSAVRCVCLLRGCISGFTLQDGATCDQYQSVLSDSDRTGGGVFRDSPTTVINCIIQNCKAESGGGASGNQWSGALINCTLSGNTARYGGGAYSGSLNNCTLSGNSATLGGGIYLGKIYNCIIWDNTASDGTINNYGSNSSFYHSCSSPLPSTGADNIDTNPLFNNTDDLRIRPGSPCLNTGDNSYALLLVDLAGNPRIQEGTVDMGAYEGGVLATATPTFTPLTGGAATNSLEITISCLTEGATIRYTTDGSAPTATSLEYTSAFTIARSATVKAKAFKSDLPDSAIVTANYTVYVAAPTFDPPTSTVFTNSLPVTMACATDGVSIRYTLDGTTPTTNSLEYTTEITLTKTVTLKAKAFKSGMADSATASASYRSSILYVDASRPDDSGDGYSWSTAKKTIQSAVNTAIQSDTVLVTNGVYNTGTTITPGYSVSNRVVITKAIVVKSVNGPTATTIQGGGSYGTTSAIRCVFMTNGVLEGFTLKGGSTFGPSQSGSDGFDRFGGGVNMINAAASVTITNCIITDCMAYCGGGSAYGRLYNCTLTGNTASSSTSSAWGGGSYYGTLSNCSLTGNTASSSFNEASSYGGAAAYSTLSNCTVSHNIASTSASSSGYSCGGGVAYGTLNNCTILGNIALTLSNYAANSHGGGAYYSNLANCSLIGNTAATPSTYATYSYSYGGGSYYGTLRNCSLTGNAATSSTTLNSRSGGGGSYFDTLYNCIVWANTRRDVENHISNYDNSTFSNSCTTPLPQGAGNISADPMFANAQTGDVHLRPDSPCLDTGSNDYANYSTDLSGSPRIKNATIDMGAYEGAAIGYFIDVSVTGAGSVYPSDVQVVTNGASITFIAQPVTRPFIGFLTNGVFATAATNFVWSNIPAIGNGELTAVFETRNLYVNASRIDDTGNGLSWDTAKQTIQSAVNVAELGDVVFVTNGTYSVGTTTTPGYSVKNRLVITKPISVISVNGPSVTIITGSGTNFYGTSSAIRCVFMSSGLLDGFTLRNGATYNTSQSSSPYDRSGGGVNAYGAVAGTEVRNCIINQCRSDYGGGTSYAIINGCTLTGNTAIVGGGSYYGTQSNSTLAGNTATYVGAGQVGGGGAAYGILNNCILSGNIGGTYGGGANGSILNNCLVKGNTASTGGGAYNGTLVNCTIVANTGAGECGVNSVELFNSIVWENRRINGVVDNGSAYVVSCSYVNRDPLFCDSVDYRLQALSPCINSGSNAYVTIVTDLNGNPRVQDGTVDMGAYEGIGGVTSPSFSPVSGTTRTNSISVALSCTTAGATIRYTTDNSEPNIDSTVFASTITLTNTTTIKAKAFKAGMLESATMTASYIVIQTVAQPIFTPFTGGTATNFLEISLACSTDGATLRYTTDGSAPTADSPEYTNLFNLTRSATVKAKAFKSGMADSATATATYTVYADAPVFDPPTGTVATNSVTFSLSCTTDGADIRFTTNGVDPAITSTLYTNAVTVTQSATVKARAFKSGLTNSATATASYTVIQTVATPAFTPTSGTIATNSLAVTLTCATAGATIRYTLDGSEPTAASSNYTATLTLTQSATVKAKAFKSGMADSAVSAATYEIISSATTPTFTPVSGTTFINSLDVTISCATQDAVIRYTLDGSAPTTASPIYSDPITLTKTTTVQAKAFKVGMGDSATASASYRCTILYVDAARPDDSGDGSGWPTAKKTIQAAVTAAFAGDTVLVTNGVYDTGTTLTPGYAVSNRVVVTKAITIRSINGAGSTIIEGSGFTAYGTASAIRCVYMSTGVLDGFALRNGATFDNAQSASAYNNGGGGVCMVGAVAGTEVRNCVIQNCKAYSGGAAYQAALTNCVMNQNWSYMNGGGAYTGTLLDCVISANSAGGSGGGAYQSVLLRCKLADNTASTSGGGSYEGALTDCSLTGNSATSNGGGSYYGTLSRCAYSGNTAASGGGSYYGTLNNCTFSRNTATSGGGAYYGTLDSCTLSDNTATSGGGTFNGTFYNCIIWGNAMPNGTPNNYSGGTFRHSCTTPLIAGLGNIASDPLLVNADDLRIRTGSPCLNSGNNAYGTGSLDILGNPRIQEGTVDMGAYEGIVPCVPMPTFAPASGAVFTNSLAVTLTNSMAETTMRYTLDGSDPTTNSQVYTGAFLIYDSATVKVKAFKSGLAESLTATATYTEIETVATPVFTPASGTVRTNSLSVTLTCATPGAVIRYTLDGSEPSAGSALFTSMINLAQSTTVKAKAFKSGMIDSATASADYTVVQTVAAPVISPVTGSTFTNSLVITLTCATADAAIRYTLDGTSPTSGSTLYSKPVKISRNTVIRVCAFKAGMLDSQIVESSFFKDLTLAEAVDVTNMVFTTGGNATWEGRMLAAARDGIDAAQSGVITDSQLTWMETTVNGAGTFSFWWKASCEDDPDYDNWDYVRFLVDGVELHRLDGITGWLQITCTLGAGAHVIRWEYSKDESLGDGDDRAWVDQLSFNQGVIPPTVTTTTPVPVPYLWLDQYPVLLSLAGGDYEAAANADVDGDGHMAWQEYVTGSIPTNRDSFFRSLIAMSNSLPWVTWSPDLGTARVYKVDGRTNLTDAAWGPTNAASHFFRVKVEMP